MDTPLTIQLMLTTLEIIVAVVAGVGAVFAIIKFITSIHDRNKKLDSYETQIKEVKDSIADLQSDTDAKMQEIRDEQCIMTDSILAILEGLHQLNCNGPVTEARENLTNYINNRAHGVGEKSK